MEIWEKISDNNNYMVSNTGKIKSFNYNNNGKYLKLSTRSKNGVKTKRKLYVVLCRNYNKKVIPVNEIVYKTFVGKIPNGYTVYNKNGNYEDNNVDNLILIKKNENLCLKLAYDTDVEKKEKKQYIYYINGNKVGKLCEFMKYIPKQSKENISERFRRWEAKSNRNPKGILFGDMYCIRKIEYINCNHINRLKNIKAKYGV